MSNELSLFYEIVNIGFFRPFRSHLVQVFHTERLISSRKRSYEPAHPKAKLRGVFRLAEIIAKMEYIQITF
jgi:flagellar basal body rod protein FlgC